MEHEDLMKSMDEGVEEKKVELRKKAEEAAKAIRCDAKTRAAEVRKARLDAAVAAMKAERNHAFYATKNEMGKDLTAAKYRLFDRAFGAAAEALAGLRSDGGYPACYRQLVAEALGELDDPSGVLHIDPRDADVCREALDGLGERCGVVPDLQCAGGLNASSPDGKVVVSNTVEARLEKAKDRLKLDVFAALFGD
ncbi:MAG TPA: V-type ATP synthase subunit E [Methanocella sp.]|nr:V-type ATP synthase subunit E [Methanocella sp.]